MLQNFVFRYTVQTVLCFVSYKKINASNSSLKKLKRNLALQISRLFIILDINLDSEHDEDCKSNSIVLNI